MLPLQDAVLRESLSATLTVDLDDIRWSHASLPIRWGGLGVRSVVLLALSAYLASATRTTELTSILLPDRLRGVKDSGADAALAAWTSQAANAIKVSTPSPQASTVQRIWDEHCCNMPHV